MYCVGGRDLVEVRTLGVEVRRQSGTLFVRERGGGDEEEGEDECAQDPHSPSPRRSELQYIYDPLVEV